MLFLCPDGLAFKLLFCCFYVQMAWLLSYYFKFNGNLLVLAKTTITIIVAHTYG